MVVVTTASTPPAPPTTPTSQSLCELRSRDVVMSLDTSVTHSLLSSSSNVVESSLGMDHVDGHTLSSVPLTSVGCSDSTLLTSLFQDSVTEGFIDFSDINGQQGVLTPVSSVFASTVYSTSTSPQYNLSTTVQQGTSEGYTATSPGYSVHCTTPVYSTIAAGGRVPSDGKVVYLIDNSTVFEAGNAIEFPAGEEFSDTALYSDIDRQLEVQDLECMNIQQIKCIEQAPRSHNTNQSNRLEVLCNTWAGNLKQQLIGGSQDWKDLTIRCKASKDIETFKGFMCHRFILALNSPVLCSWLKDIENVDEEACIILPDFTEKEVKQFLNVLYLDNNQHTPMFDTILRCLNGVNRSDEKSKSLRNTSTQSSIVAQQSERGKKVVVVNLPSKKGEECKLEEKTEFRFKRAQVEIKMEEFEKLEAEKVNSVKLQKVQDEVSPGSNVKKARLMHESTISSSSSKNTKSTKPSTSGSDVGDSVISKPEFRCEVCQKVFKQNRILKEHMDIHAEPKFICNLDGCDKKFHSKSNYNAHIDVIHLKNKTESCDVCGKMFYNKTLLRKHKASHGSNQFECPHCDYVAKCKKTINSHIKAIHYEDTAVCPICHKTVSNQNILKSHINRVHNGQKMFGCRKCSMKFFSKYDLLQHEKTHEPADGDESLRCSICSVVFKNMKNLKNHLDYVHRNPEPKHVCYQCGKGFKKTYHLNRHLEMHKRLSISCKLCKLSFSCEAKLERHVKSSHRNQQRTASKQAMNPKVEDAACINSDHEADTKSNLISQINIHSQDKVLPLGGPNKCEHCAQSFGDNPLVSYVQEHYRTCELKNR